MSTIIKMSEVALNDVRKLNNEQLITVIKKNGYAGLAPLIEAKKLTGDQFLTLTEIEIRYWNVPLSIAKSIWACIESINQRPRSFSLSNVTPKPKPLGENTKKMKQKLEADIDKNKNKGPFMYRKKPSTPVKPPDYYDDAEYLRPRSFNSGNSQSVPKRPPPPVPREFSRKSVANIYSTSPSRKGNRNCNQCYSTIDSDYLECKVELNHTDVEPNDKKIDISAEKHASKYTNIEHEYIKVLDSPLDPVNLAKEVHFYDSTDNIMDCANNLPVDYPALPKPPQKNNKFLFPNLKKMLKNKLGKNSDFFDMDLNFEDYKTFSSEIHCDDALVSELKDTFPSQSLKKSWSVNGIDAKTNRTGLTKSVSSASQRHSYEMYYVNSVMAFLPRPPPTFPNMFELKLPVDSPCLDNDYDPTYQNDPFYRNTSRAGAKRLLADRHDGAFLLRPSSHKNVCITLTVKVQKKVLNFQIKELDNHSVLIDSRNEPCPEFDTISDLYRYFMKRPLTYINALGVCDSVLLVQDLTDDLL